MDQTPLGEDSGKVSKRRGFGHTLAPSNLWFYRCNNCNLILPRRHLRENNYPGYQGEMLLCRRCYHAYRIWQSGDWSSTNKTGRKHGGSGNAIIGSIWRTG